MPTMLFSSQNNSNQINCRRKSEIARFIWPRRKLKEAEKKVNKYNGDSGSQYAMPNDHNWYANVMLTGWAGQTQANLWLLTLCVLGQPWFRPKQRHQVKFNLFVDSGGYLVLTSCTVIFTVQSPWSETSRPKSIDSRWFGTVKGKS